MNITIDPHSTAAITAVITATGASAETPMRAASGHASRRSDRSRRCAAVGLVVVAGLLAACTDNSGGSSDAAAVGGASSGGAAGRAISVVSTDDVCTLSSSSVPAGNVAFDVRNDGSKVTEFYLYRANGTSIVGEAENIGPGITRRLVVTAGAGTYVAACKPGMTGDGIRSELTLTSDSDAPVSADSEHAAALATATAGYATFVRSEAAALLTKTTEFAALFAAGNDPDARALYAAARMHWERIEPVAESFGDLDPRLDLREADLEAGQEWTGWHRIEKELWPPAQGAASTSEAERKALADQLVADTTELVERVGELEYTPAQLGNGAKELLDEVATGKVTGEEEIWSHTDLWDFQANVEGARAAFEALEPVVVEKDATLATTIDERFTALQSLLDRYRDGEGFVTYDTLTPAQVKGLADAVNALGEPLAQLTSAVVL